MSKFPKFRDEFCPFTKEPCRSDCQFYAELERQSDEVENTFSECWLSTAALNLVRFADVFEHLILLSRQSDGASLRIVGHEEAEEEERLRHERLAAYARRQRLKANTSPEQTDVGGAAPMTQSSTHKEVPHETHIG